jgi:SAM-dependent methyltransferase
MHDHVRLTMGTTKWIEYARDAHLIPLADKLKAANPDEAYGVDLMSIGCGNGWIEKNILAAGWPIRRILCLEYDTDLLRSAEENLAEFDIDKQFHSFDMNQSLSFDFEAVHVAFFCHSLHHCSDVEGILRFLNKSIPLDGIIMGLDYFGPNRLQVEPDIRELLDEIFPILPGQLRLNLSSNITETKFEWPTISDMINGDPSEAPRSRDIRSLFFSNFPVLDLKPMGGTLLRPLISCRAASFRSPEEIAILQLLQLFERALIRKNVISSDDLFFVCGRSSRI